MFAFFKKKDKQEQFLKTVPHFSDKNCGKNKELEQSAEASSETKTTLEKPFWRTKSLAQMSEAEWESLCDGCGRCCMHKIEDEDSGDIYATSVGCQLLDNATCQCLDYPDRQTHVPDCIKLTRQMISGLNWLPEDCAYKLIDKGRDLKWWHYLKSGSRETIHKAGISVQDKIEIRENEISDPLETLNYITTRIWKGRK